jgi:hypothetical protein
LMRDWLLCYPYPSGHPAAKTMPAEKGLSSGNRHGYYH